MTCSPGARLLAHPLVMDVCDAVLACQALRMPPAELRARLVVGGSFTSQRPLRQFSWELDYARCDGAVHAAPNPPPAVPSLLSLEQQITAIWQLSADVQQEAGVLGGTSGGVPVCVSGVGTLLLALGAGARRWTAPKTPNTLQASHGR